MTQRYLVSHPLINKESYIQTDTIRAVYIPHDSTPMVLNDSFTEICQYVFSTITDISYLPMNQYFHMAMSTSFSFSERNINHMATSFYRIHKNIYTHFIYGPAILLGSLDPLTGSSHKVHYSVPYEVLEQLSNMLKQ